jgi:hypothetical protein
MPGKHVRFAVTSTAPPAPIPSLSYSVPSAPSSSIPRTPTSHSSGSLPSHSRPRPKRTHSHPLPTRVHNLLAYSHHPLINYDVSLPPSNITTTHKSLSSASFHEPAVHPPVSSLVIQIPHHVWPISVYASHNGQYVTVNDVLTTIYHSLRTNVSSSEYRATSKKDAEKVRKAYEMRYKRLRDRNAHLFEKQQGIKRVDFLNRHTRFMGLTNSSGVWKLHLS